MKILSILISFALINVLVALIEEGSYEYQVYLTNKYCQLSVVSNIYEMHRSGHLKTVVKNIVLNRQYSMVEMAVMLVVPETNEDLVMNHGKLWYQQKLISEILAVTGRRIIHVEKVELDHGTMTSLGAERRLYTCLAIKNAIHAIEICKDDDWISAFSDFSRMCRLIGIFRSFLNVCENLRFIKSAEVHDGTCVLKALDMSETKYRYVDGEIWQLKADGTKFQTLRRQVE